MSSVNPERIKAEKRLSIATTTPAPNTAPVIGNAMPPNDDITGSVNSATPKEAPELTPKIEGPARGL